MKKWEMMFLDFLTLRTFNYPICTFYQGAIYFRLETCPGGWEEFGSYCYQLRRNGKHWIGAEYDCTTAGGHLASIHSQSENDFIYGLTLGGYGAYWLGGSDYASEVINSSMIKTTD